MILKTHEKKSSDIEFKYAKPDENGNEEELGIRTAWDALSAALEDDTESQFQPYEAIKLTEEDVIIGIELLEVEDNIDIIGDSVLDDATPVVIVSPSGVVLNATEYDTHQDLLDRAIDQLGRPTIHGNDVYTYVVEELGFMTLNTGDGFSENRLKIVIKERPTAEQINKLRRWLDTRFKEDLTKEMYIYTGGPQKTYPMMDEDTNSIIKKINRAFSTGFLEELDDTVYYRYEIEGKGTFFREINDLIDKTFIDNFDTATNKYTDLEKVETVRDLDTTFREIEKRVTCTKDKV